MPNLDAFNFSGSILFYDAEFEEILSKVTMCYQLMKEDKVILENNENEIRNKLLLDYLKNNEIRQKVNLLQWHFEREIQEDHSVGRTDIKIISPNTFINQEAYYILECKRLDNTNIQGTTGLNAEYIKNGIDRFVTKYYSLYYRVNGMIGFIVEELNIDENIQEINTLLKDTFSSISTHQAITKEFLINDFEFHYSSIHKDIEGDDLKIYHLMFDFNENIQNI